MEETKNHFDENEQDKPSSEDSFETVSLEYSKDEARQSIINTLFPFSAPGKERLYGLLAFFAAAAFFAIPGIVSMMAFIMPRDQVLNYIAGQTQDFFKVAVYALSTLALWLLLGRITDCLANKKKFLPYDSFSDFLKKNVVRIMLFAVIVLMTISGLINKSNTENAFTNVTDGIFTWYFVALGAVLISLVKSEKQMRILLIVFTASAVLTCFVMFIQYVTLYKRLTLNSIGDFFKLWQVDFSKVQPVESLAHLRGVFSNSNHYGYYLCLSALACAGLYVTGDSLWKRLLSALGFILFMITMVLNDTLGAQLAIIITVLLLPVAFIRSKTPIFRRFVPMIAMICVMVFMSVFPQLPIGSMALRNSIDEIKYNIKKITSYEEKANDSRDIVLSTENDGTKTVSLGKTSPNADTAVQLASSENDSSEEEENRWWLKNQELGTSRLGLWQYGIHLIGQKPIFGYGVNGTKSLFHNESGLKKPAARVHNEYLQIGIDCGIPAMLIHIASYIMVVIYFFRAMKKRQLSLYQRIMFCMFVAYAISAFMGICAYYTASYFYIWLGLLISTFEGSFHEYPKPEEKEETEESAPIEYDPFQELSDGETSGKDIPVTDTEN